jgi:predicted peroxiredoxin
MADDIVFLYGWGPEEEGRLSSMLYLAETASAIDMNATVFFFTDAAILAKKGIFSKMTEDIERRFKKNLIDERVQFYVCEEAARKRGLTQEKLENGLVIAGYATFLDMAASAKTVITI